MTRNGHGAAAGGTPGLFLVNIPFYHAGCAEAPLGLAYVAAVLERSGIPFELLDANGLGMSLKDILAVVREKQPGAGRAPQCDLHARERPRTRRRRERPPPPAARSFSEARTHVAPRTALERGGRYSAAGGGEEVSWEG